MNTCKFTISDPLKRVHSRKELEDVFWSKFMSEDEKTEMRNFVRKISIEHSVKMLHDPPEGWDKETFSYTVIWESKHPLEEYVDKFFNHPLFVKNILLFKQHGFELSEPVFS